MTRRIGNQLALTLCGLLAAAGWPGESLALDDGGGRSIFADGAGNRALSMGGAFGAISDDASAVLWNPAGLGIMQRYEFQATHTNLIGFGFSEQYASMVVPSWRFGVWSITYRHFGVDGIEQRDDRNLLLADDLANTESELTLAFSRELSPAWSLGGGLKLRSQQLVGHSDSGLGLDLGVMVRPLVAVGSPVSWADDLSVGVAIRNAVKPTLRLVEDSVPDPTGLRVATAYRRVLGRQQSVQAAVDYEKTQENNGRWHAGLEVVVLPQLALRTGVNNGTWVAGAGVRWRGIGVDYSFEDLSPVDIHRVGVSMQFGTTRDERQRLALNAEEDELTRRLERAFTVKAERRIAELMLQAQRALREERLDDAAESVAMLKVMAPDHTGLAQLESSLLRNQATVMEDAHDYTGAMVALGKALQLTPDDTLAASMLQRVRARSHAESARSTEIREMLDGALDAFASGDLLAARSGFEKVLAVQPRDSGAATMLRRTEEAIERRVEELTSQVRVLAKAGQFDDARGLLRQVRELDPDGQSVDSAAAFMAAEHSRQLLAESRRAEQRQTESKQRTANRTPNRAASPAAQPQAVTVSPQRQQEMVDLYRRGMESAQSGSAREAVHYWEIVWSIDPDYQQVTDYLTRQYLAWGMEAFVAGDLQEAVNNWENAVRVNPSDKKALGYLARAQEQMQRMKQLD